MTQLPTITTMAQIGEHAGERVRVVGRYTLQDVRKRRTPPAVYAGHATVRLSDGTAVLLEPAWAPEAIRPDDERQRHTNQMVAVVGLIFPRAPQSPDGSASLLMPCMINIETISASPKATTDE